MTGIDDHDTVPRASSGPVLVALPEPDGADTVLRDPPVRAHPETHDVENDAEPESDPAQSERLFFRISDGSVELIVEEDVHIGRNPRPPRSEHGGPVRLLRVQSPSGVISSSHLGLRRVGSTAVAADLMSTNGTVVLLPGFGPRRLRQGETLVAPPGTRLEIGEGIVIEVFKRGALD